MVLEPDCVETEVWEDTSLVWVVDDVLETVEDDVDEEIEVVFELAELVVDVVDVEVPA